MKVILYMAISADGFIARKDDSVSWSDEEWNSCSSTVKDVGNILIGRKTLELFDRGDFKDMGDPVVFCLTSKVRKSEGKIVFVNNIKEACNKAKEQNFKTLLVLGGSKTNRTALESGLIDEMYLDVEPIVYGDGLPLFSSTNKESRLKLLDSKKIGTSGVQLHYKVIK